MDLSLYFATVMIQSKHNERNLIVFFKPRYQIFSRAAWIDVFTSKQILQKDFLRTEDFIFHDEGVGCAIERNRHRAIYVFTTHTHTHTHAHTHTHTGK